MQNTTPLVDFSVKSAEGGVLYSRNIKNLYNTIANNASVSGKSAQFSPHVKKISNFDPNADILDISQQAFLLAGLQKNNIDLNDMKPDLKIGSNTEKIKIKTENVMKVIKNNNTQTELTYNKFGLIGGQNI